MDRFLDALLASVEPTTRPIGAVAAALRSSQGSALRLPDALVIAAAVVLKADWVLTTDARWLILPVRFDVLA